MLRQEQSYARVTLMYQHHTEATMSNIELLNLIKEWADSYARQNDFTDPGAEEGALMVLTDLKKVIQHQQTNVSQ